MCSLFAFYLDIISYGKIFDRYSFSFKFIKDERKSIIDQSFLDNLLTYDIIINWILDIFV